MLLTVMHLAVALAAHKSMMPLPSCILPWTMLPHKSMMALPSCKQGLGFIGLLAKLSEHCLTGHEKPLRGWHGACRGLAGSTAAEASPAPSDGSAQL